MLMSVLLLSTTVRKTSVSSNVTRKHAPQLKGESGEAPPMTIGESEEEVDLLVLVIVRVSTLSHTMSLEVRVSYIEL